MRHISLDELKERAKPVRPSTDMSNSVRKFKATVAKLKALIPVVTDAATEHPDL
jgi:hypothetical protein